MYDPSIGQESLTSIDEIGVLVGHLLFGIGATLLLDWSWIPLSKQQRESGRSLNDIKKQLGWDTNKMSKREKEANQYENLLAKKIKD